MAFRAVHYRTFNAAVGCYLKVSFRPYRETHTTIFAQYATAASAPSEQPSKTPGLAVDPSQDPKVASHPSAIFRGLYFRVNGRIQGL
jgi:hypothetical protein